jgi:RimJ/RimL family protein N-acetyltransferase
MSDCPCPPLYTRRLLLQPLTTNDASAFQALFAQWEMVRYLTHLVPWPYPEGEALRYIRDIALPAVADGEEWHWTLRLREEPNQVIGVICVMDEPGNNRGFWLGQQWQRRGLMTEACAAATQFWFQTLQRPLMQVAKAQINEASRRISKREGMRMIERSEDHFVCGPMEQEVWEITREEWLRLHTP